MRIIVNHYQVFYIHYNNLTPKTWRILKCLITRDRKKVMNELRKKNRHGWPVNRGGKFSISVIWHGALFSNACSHQVNNWSLSFSPFIRNLRNSTLTKSTVFIMIISKIRLIKLQRNIGYVNHNSKDNHLWFFSEFSMTIWSTENSKMK